MHINDAVIRNVTPCDLVHRHERFVEKHAVSIFQKISALKMEAGMSSETMTQSTNVTSQSLR
jgi:hypothetical protein